MKVKNRVKRLMSNNDIKKTLINMLSFYEYVKYLGIQNPILIIYRDYVPQEIQHFMFSCGYEFHHIIFR